MLKRKTKKSQKKSATPQTEESRLLSFLDMIAPSTLKFYADHYLRGNVFGCVWAIRDYPSATAEQALLSNLGEKDNVTLHLYARHVHIGEQARILENATNANRMNFGSTDMVSQITAESNLEDMGAVIRKMATDREVLLHCAVYLEMCADSYDELKLLQTEVQTELVRGKLGVDKLILRQKEGLQSIMPTGRNHFGQQFERVLPASSVANLYPLSYSGKTDAGGFYIGKDKYGSNIIVDFDKRADDKTNANVLILGNSGQGKSYLMKLIIINFRMAGKHMILLDPEEEYQDLTHHLGGSYIDFMSGKYIINVLEPKMWSDSEEDEDSDSPSAFQKSSVLSQHISFLRDYFRSYKDFTDSHIDTLEIMLQKLYTKWGITDRTDLTALAPTDFPILSDLYELIQEVYEDFDEKKREVYTAQLLQEVLLGIHSMCIGAESTFFNGHTNVDTSHFVTFGVKGLLEASTNIRNALLFNLLSFMSHQLLTKGNTVASIDELYLFLSNPVAVEYIRNFMKRVRKKDSAIIIASQNLEDFNVDGIRELTKPLFSVPVHQFLFNPGSVDKSFYISNLQLESGEYKLIETPERGNCLYKCGNERYNLQVIAPEHKERLFGAGGGR